MAEAHTGIPSMLIFCVAFLGIFSLLIMAMPSLAPNLLYEGKTYSNYDIPEYFSKDDIESIKYFLNDTVLRNFPTGEAWYDFTADINFKFVVRWNSISNNIVFLHVTWQFFIFNQFAPMTVINTSNTISSIPVLTKDIAVEKWDVDINASLINPVYCDHISTKVWLTDSNTTRNNISEAWDDGSLNIGIGFGFDDVTASYSAWNLIGILITFQRPDIFGASGAVALLLNGIIAIPLFLCIAYLIFYFITSIIPFIRGA